MRPKKKPAIAPRPQEPHARQNETPKRHVIAAFAVCAITLLAFSNSFHIGFAWDNRYLILQDPRIRGASAENIGKILQHTYWWPTGEAGIYRPLTTLSYLFNYAVLGQREQPAGYHWTNFILHSINVLLVYALAIRLVRRFWPSVFIAAIWGVHPALTESVTNIIGRADLLAAMATLGGLLMYLKSTDVCPPKRPTDPGGNPSAVDQGVRPTAWRKIFWLAGLMAVTAAGVFSKESAVVIVGVIALYELAWWSERHAPRFEPGSETGSGKTMAHTRH